MKLIITENQYNKILLEYYDSDKLYEREAVVNRLKNAPKYIKEYIPKLPHIECLDSNGNVRTCTKIPEVLYQYLKGNF